MVEVSRAPLKNYPVLTPRRKSSPLLLELLDPCTETDPPQPTVDTSGHLQERPVSSHKDGWHCWIEYNKKKR